MSHQNGDGYNISYPKSLDNWNSLSTLTYIFEVSSWLNQMLTNRYISICYGDDIAGLTFFEFFFLTLRNFNCYLNAFSYHFTFPFNSEKRNFAWSSLFVALSIQLLSNIFSFLKLFQFILHWPTYCENRGWNPASLGTQKLQ